ncbi:MAG: hypothetical protein AB7F89_22305, partial [Pirellulaceae bacterium]
EVGELPCPRMAFICCEHEELITVGRDGSRAHLRYESEPTDRQPLRVQWVSRGGGCIHHGPGQLAIYPIVPLRCTGWSVGDYLRRFQAGLQGALNRLHYHTAVPSAGFGIWGHSGLLAAIGVAVRQETTVHGGFLNVNPVSQLARYVETVAMPPHPGDSPVRRPMSSLLAERRVPITMNAVRAALIEGLSEVFQCGQVHIHAAHPMFPRPPEIAGESCAHV